VSWILARDGLASQRRGNPPRLNRGSTTAGHVRLTEDRNVCTLQLANLRVHEDTPKESKIADTRERTATAALNAGTAARAPLRGLRAWLAAFE
jgi:hypothetical protein